MSGRNPRFSITVDLATAQRYLAAAATEKRSVGNLAQVAIEEYIRRREEDRKRQQRRKEQRVVLRQQGEAQRPVEASAASPGGGFPSPREISVVAPRSESRGGGQDA